MNDKRTPTREAGSTVSESQSLVAWLPKWIIEERILSKLPGPDEVPVVIWNVAALCVLALLSVLLVAFSWLLVKICLAIFDLQAFNSKQGVELRDYALILHAPPEA